MSSRLLPFLAVGLGGACGSMLRHGLTLLLTRWTAGAAFPVATLAVNVAGCLAIGLFYGFAEPRFGLGHPSRLLLGIGFLGGFTTYSAFGYETFSLLAESRWGHAAAHALLHLALGLAAVASGIWLSRAL